MTNCKNCGQRIRAKNYPTDMTLIHRETINEVCINPQPKEVLK